MADPGPPLLTAGDLTEWLGFPVTPAKLEVIEKVVWGWLKRPLGLDTRPAPGDPLADEVYSWALELAAIAHENPSGLTAKQLGDENQQFSAERRDEILAAAAGATAGTSLPPAPRGCFPPALPYPDPAFGRGPHHVRNH